MSRDKSPALSDASGPENEQVTVAIQSEHLKTPLQIKISVNDTVDDVQQYLLRMAPIGQPLTNFSLVHSGSTEKQPLDPTLPVSQLLPDDDNNKKVDLYMAPKLYNESSSLAHIRKVREAVGFLPANNTSSFSVNAGFSAFSQLEPEILANIPETPETKQKVSTTDDNEVVPLKSYETGDSQAFLELCHKNQTANLGTDPLNAIKPAVKAIQLSQWNPPLPQYRFKGHLFYLYVATLESKTYHIVSTTEGFYVSNSTAEKFDPSIKKAKVSISLFELLKNLSPLLVGAMDKNQEALSNVNNLAIASPSNSFLASPWLVESSPATTRIPDASRAQSLFAASSSGTTTTSLRDWNEDLQAAKEQSIQDESSQVVLQEKLLKERVLNKFSFDFTEAAVKGALEVVAGNVVALNPEEVVSARIYLHEGIFYSFGTDGAGTFSKLGGDAAARYSSSKDLQAINYINNLDIEDLYTLWTVIVDYCGQRVICQTPVPGIFRDSDKNGSTIIYGSIDNRSKIAADEKMAPLMKELADLCHLKPHKAYDVNGNGTQLYTSLETKGLNGTDGRNYILDLYRMVPLDISFLEKYVDEQEDNNDSYPHSVPVLRHEAVDIWFREQVQAAWLAAKGGGEEDKDEKEDDAEKDQEALRAQQEKIYKEVSEKCRLNCDISKLDESLVPESEKEQFLKEKEAVRKVSEFVSDTLVPKFVADVVNGVLLTPLDGAFLTNILHKRGINMRYLGHIVDLARREGPKLTALCYVLESEAVSRAVKHLLHNLIRYKSHREITSTIIDFLNKLFTGDASTRSEIKLEVLKRFRMQVSDDFWSTSSISTYLFKEISQKLGLQWKHKQYFQSENRSGDIFKHDDLVNIAPIIKNTVYRSKMADDALEAGKLCIARGDKETGLGLLEESLSLYEQVYGLVHPEVSRAYINIAMVYHELKDASTASELCRKSLIIAERTLGVDSGETLFCYLNLSLFEYSRGNALGALIILETLLKYWYTFVGQFSNPHVLTTVSNVAAMLQNLELFESSLKWFLLSLHAANLQYGEDSAQAAAAHYQVSQAYACVRDFHSAVNHMRSAYNKFLKVKGEDDENTKDCKKWMENLVQAAVNVAKMKKPGFGRLSGSRDAKVNVPYSSSSTIQSGVSNNSATKLGEKNINDLVNYVNGTETDTKTKRSKSKSKKKSNKKR